MSLITHLLNHYGYIVLIIALFLELIAFPLPGELLMSYCGFLVFEGKLNFYLCILFSTIGAILGITVSYLIGKKFGVPFFNRYGKYVHFGPDKIDKTSQWFDKYGDRLLIFAFFIFGVRHITGYFSGITRIVYKRFAFNAYLGALIWCSTFIYLGKVFGQNWQIIHQEAARYLFVIAVSIIIILVLIYVYKTFQAKISNYLTVNLKKLFGIYQSYRKIKIIITAIIGVTLTLLLLVFGLIQDFLGNEFTKFDSITTYIISSTFNHNWDWVMKLILNSISLPIVILLTSLLILWVLKNGENKALEIRSILLIIIGGGFLQELLTRFFKLIKIQALVANDTYTFPSEQTFMAIVTFGLLLYYLIRYNKKIIINHLATIFFIILCLAIGISTIYLNIQYPIDVVAGYEIGGVWLGLNIILLETNRLLIKLKKLNN